MNWQFPALLVAAMVASIVLSMWQQRRYLRVVNAMAREYKGPDRRLVSGRGKGRLRGAVVVLVIDTVQRTVLAARVMSGSTVLAKLRPAPGLEGSLDTLRDRASDTFVVKAIDDALRQLPTGDQPAAPLDSTPKPARIRVGRP